METYTPGKFILCFIVNCCLWSWIGGKGVGNREILWKEFSVFFQDIFIKKKTTNKPTQNKNLWPGLHTDSSKIKHIQLISFEASWVQLWVIVVVHVEKTISRQMPCAGLLLFPSAFALLQGNGGSKQYPFQETMCSKELSVPIHKEQICSVHKTFLFAFPVNKFEIMSSVDIVSLLFYCCSQKLCRCFHCYLIVSRAVALLWTLNCKLREIICIADHTVQRDIRFNTYCWSLLSYYSVLFLSWVLHCQM